MLAIILNKFESCCSCVINCPTLGGGIHLSILSQQICTRLVFSAPQRLQSFLLHNDVLIWKFDSHICHLCELKTVKSWKKLSHLTSKTAISGESASSRIPLNASCDGKMLWNTREHSRVKALWLELKVAWQSCFYKTVLICQHFCNSML